MILTKYELGEAVDKDPEWRVTARYSREELEILISDPRLPIDRRMFCALEGIAGLRLGEAAGLRVDRRARLRQTTLCRPARRDRQHAELLVPNRH